MAASERDERARSDWWRNRLAVLDLSRLVFVGECGSNVVGLAPLRARAPRGERAHGKAPRNRGKYTTLLLASKSAEGMGPCVVAVEGETTARVFEAYVGQVLAPALRPGQVMVLHNLGAHKGDRRIRELLEASGCELKVPTGVLLSPGLSPIEEAVSKLKALLGGRALTKEEALVVEAIGRALDAVSGRDARGFFDHCGYPFRGQLPCEELL